MSLPTLHKAWSFSTNNRISYVSLADVSAHILYGVKNFLVATMGYTVKYTCDGTTGPASGADHTDRWTSSAACLTRGTNTTTAQSFCVLTDGSGADILLTFQGSTDQNLKMSFSQGGLFTPAATANQQPTATDEAIALPNTSSVTGATTSGDRIWHCMATTDKKNFRAYVHLTGFMTYSFGMEIVSPAVFGFSWPSPTVVGWATNISNPTAASAGHPLQPSTTVGNAGIARINGVNLYLGGGGEIFCGNLSSAVFGENNVPLQGGAPCTAIGFYSVNAGMQGKVGDRFDAYFCWSNALAQGDTLGANQWVFFGATMVPWNGGPVVIA